MGLSASSVTAVRDGQHYNLEGWMGVMSPRLLKGRSGPKPRPTHQQGVNIMFWMIISILKNLVGIDKPLAWCNAGASDFAEGENGWSYTITATHANTLDIYGAYTARISIPSHSDIDLEEGGVRSRGAQTGFRSKADAEAWIDEYRSEWASNQWFKLGEILRAQVLAFIGTGSAEALSAFGSREHFLNWWNGQFKGHWTKDYLYKLQQFVLTRAWHEFSKYTDTTANTHQHRCLVGLEGTEECRYHTEIAYKLGHLINLAESILGQPQSRAVVEHSEAIVVTERGRSQSASAHVEIPEYFDAKPHDISVEELDWERQPCTLSTHSLYAV